MVAISRWTAEQVRQIPDDGKRYEVVDGQLLVTPAPRFAHQAVVAKLFLALREYLAVERVAQALTSPADIELDPATMVQPDIFVFRLRSGVTDPEWTDIEELLLVIEVLSPNTARFDRGLKRNRYQRHGIAEYWIVDIDARLIERWRSDESRPEIVSEKLVWKPDGARAPLVVDVAELTIISPS
jgi:Uma2 family endonuclease